MRTERTQAESSGKLHERAKVMMVMFMINHGGDVGGGDNDDGCGFSHDDYDGCDGGIEMKETNSERMWPGGRENYKES